MDKGKAGRRRSSAEIVTEGKRKKPSSSELHKITKILNAKPEDVHVQSPLSKLRSSEHWDVSLQGLKRSLRNKVLSLDHKSKKGVRGHPVTSKISPERQLKVMLTNVLWTDLGRKFRKTLPRIDANLCDANKVQSDSLPSTSVDSLETCQKLEPLHQSLNLSERIPRVILTNILGTKLGRKYIKTSSVTEANLGDTDNLQSEQLSSSADGSLESCQNLNPHKSFFLSERLSKVGFQRNTFVVPSVTPSNWDQLDVRMRVVTIVILLFFCKAAELRKASPGGARNRVNHGRAGGSRKSSNPVKRYAPGLPCEVYTYLHEKYLDCQERKLVYVLPDWPQDLLHMLLARNKIRILKNSMFSKFKKLKSLDLQQNEISKIESEAFFGLNKLTTLLLQHNQIKVLTEEVFIYTPLLSYLRLYDNPWHCTCEMETLISMLQIPRNRNLGNYAKCESPQELKNKKLRQIKSEQLCNEEGNEQLEPKPQLSGKPPVIKTEVDSSLCHNYVFPIQTLDCRRKELKKVPNNIPPDIVKLDLSHNKINQLRPKEFEDVHELKKLNLSSNGIQFIDPAAFLGLTHLEELDLSNNSLQNFDYGVLEDLYFLKLLWLRENPWRCDYNIHYLYYWLKHHYNVHYNGLECKMPEEYKGWFVGKYVRSYYEECPKDKLPAYPETFDQDMEDDEWEKIHKDHTAKKQSVRITIVG